MDADGKGGFKATLPGGGELKIERMTGPPTGVIVHIPGGDPAVVALLPGESSVLYLERSVGQQKHVPYLLGFERYEKDGQSKEFFTWRPAYRAEGKLRLPPCEVGIALLDLNGDGVFDHRDVSMGTSIMLDLNDDGRFWGSSEHRRAGEIIDVCGLPLEVEDIDPGGRSITFRTSVLKPAVLNQTVPSFSVTTSTGQLLRSDDFRGRIHVLDFWASWCAPCVAKLVACDSFARERPKDVTFIGINVDEPERRPIAEQMIREKSLSFLQVIRAQGEKDFLWKIFGSMQGSRLSVPLYVVVDREGVIRYAGNGGEDLAEVRTSMRQLLGSKEK
jgi:thiol-disulfide isomerase/thioredoxin